MAKVPTYYGLPIMWPEEMKAELMSVPLQLLLPPPSLEYEQVVKLFKDENIHLNPLSQPKQKNAM